ncbi:MAG: hypothetical protein ACOX6I_08615 [Syntrophomonadaceae bacterium]|jgi:hypothetical protein
MQDIVNEYANACKDSNLFLFWEQELALRTKIRQAVSSNIYINNDGECDFLLRSIYYSKERNLFWTIIFNNMNNVTVVNWLLAKNPELVKEFLDFVPFHIINSHPEPQQLQFLITIYNRDWIKNFEKIINVLNLESCAYLLPRSGNQELRNLIRNRQAYLKDQQLKQNYGLFGTDIKPSGLATLHGDKLSLFIAAVTKMQACSVSNFSEPFGNERINLLLDAVEAIFRTGLIADSLAVLVDIYADYLDQNRLVDISLEKHIYTRFNRLVRKILPVFALLYDPLHSYQLANNFYSQYFNLLSADMASISYLRWYEALLEALNKSPQYGLFDLIDRFTAIKRFRPHDTFNITPEEITQGFSTRRMSSFIRAIRERISSLPHEAFVIMEFVRLLIRQGNKPDKHVGSSLLTSYVDLWKWIPADMFLNHQLVNELSPWASDKERSLATRIVEGLKHYSLDRLIDDYNHKADLFRNKDGRIRLQILTARLMEVE